MCMRVNVCLDFRLSKPVEARDVTLMRTIIDGTFIVKIGSRSVFQSGGWRFNPRPSRCVLEQDT